VITLKHILITGCGSGLGHKAAITLASRGHYVYATTHTHEQAYKLNMLNRKWKLPIESFKLDVLCKEDREKVRDLPIDVLINNAAIGDSGSVAEIDVNRFRSTFETNVFCPIELTQIVLKGMIKRRKGRIIFLSSLTGRMAIPFLSPYCSTKFALESIGYCLNKELKQLPRVNIPVILIEPGSYATGFNQLNISKQFNWMKVNSYFKNRINKLQRKQYLYFKLTESSNLDSIVMKYVAATEEPHPKFRYIAPCVQGCVIKAKNILKN